MDAASFARWFNWLVARQVVDPADALRAAEYEPLLPTAQHPNNKLLAVPTGGEDARSMPNDLDDVRR